MYRELNQKISGIKKLLKFVVIGFLVTSMISCDSSAPQTKHSDYIETAFDSIKLLSLHRHTLNIDSIKNVVLNQISDTSSMADVHSAIEKANTSVDRHGYVIYKEEFKNMLAGDNPDVLSNPFPFSGKLIMDKYGFVSLDGFAGVDSIASKNYADSLQSLIFSLYQKRPKGWIIDLRNNSGGWPYPMLVGLGPILGKGVKAYKMNCDSVVMEYYYWKNETEFMTLVDSIRFIDEILPTAVIVSEDTGSAGELLTLCFRGNPLTTIIGQNTYGVSTGLASIMMPDTFVIAVTNTIMTDRYKVGDGEAIVPNSISSNWIEAFDMSYNWIESNQENVSRR